MYKTVYDGDVEKAGTKNIRQLLLGTIDIKTALSQDKDEADKKIAEAKSK